MQMHEFVSEYVINGFMRELMSEILLEGIIIPLVPLAIIIVLIFLSKKVGAIKWAIKDRMKEIKFRIKQGTLCKKKENDRK